MTWPYLSSTDTARGLTYRSRGISWPELASIVLQVCVALAVNSAPAVVAERNRLCSAVVATWGTGMAMADHCARRELDYFRLRIGDEINGACRRVRATFEEMTNAEQT